MSAEIRVELQADDATQDPARLAEPSVETNALNSGTGRENEHSSPEPLVVRTLKDPPEIWEMVHEAPRAFNPGGAFVAHVTSSKTKLILLTLVVMFVFGLSFFAVTTLRDGRNRAGADAPVQDEPVNSQAEPASQPSAPASAPVDAQLNNQSNTQLNASPGAGDGVNNTPPQPTVSGANPASADQTLSNSVQPTGESVSNSSKLTASPSDGADASATNRVSVASGWRKAGNSPRARTETETAAAPATRVAPQKPQTPAAAGVKETPNPQATAQPTTSAPNATAPKAKVIQWP